MKSVMLLLSVGLATAALAGERPLREVRSENGRFTLRVDAGRAGKAARPCRATLVDGRAERSARRVWERSLVNDAAPAAGYVRDDGRYVVTLGEHGRGGSRHALVIYGAEGELLRHFLLPDLLERSDWTHVKARGDEVVWLEGATAGFVTGAGAAAEARDAGGKSGPDAGTPEVFVLRLAWGREIRIDLRALQVLRGDRTAVLAGVPPEIQALLQGHLDDGRPVADLALESSTAEIATDELSAALTPDETLPEELNADGMPAGDHSPEPEHGEAAVDAPEKPAMESDVAGVEPVADGLPPGAPQEPWIAPDPGSDAQIRSPFTSVAVPRPDLEQRVDYVAWLNEQGRLEGPDAAPFYDAAIERMPPWTGDADLLAAAVAGDPAALASPEVMNWVAECADALELMREGAQQPARSWQYHSPSGALLGVELPNLGGYRSLARANLVAARQELAAGNPAAAAERCLDVLSVGVHASDGLTLIENLVGVAVQSQGAETLLDLQREAGDQLDLAQLAADARIAFRPVRNPADALQGERAMFLDTLQRSWDLDPAGGEPVLNREAARELLKMADLADAQIEENLDRVARIGFRDTEAEGSIYYDALTEAFSLPFAEGRRQLGQLEEIMTHPQMNPLLRTFIPALSRCQFIHTRSEASRRAVLAVTQLNAYRQQHGDYPESLDALGDPELATDPFAGQRFQYRRTPEGYTLYSVGANGVDDGGQHDQKGETGDVVFWPRPAR